MGNSESDSRTEIENFLQYYTEYNTVDSNLYGDVETYKNNKQEGKFVCLSNKLVQDEEEILQHEKLIDARQYLNHDSLVQLLCVGKHKSDEFCSSAYQLSYIYEYIEYNLGSDIFQRQSNGMAFYDENELWIIILSTIAGLCFLNDQNITWLDIKPSNILINSESKYQLLPRPPFSNQINSYQECLYQQNPENLKYLSPILLENLRDSIPQPLHDPVKSDLFTFGITIIEAALLKQITHVLYDWEDFKIRQEVLENALNELSMKYSQNLMVFVGRMVMLDENYRPGCQQLFDELERLLLTLPADDVQLIQKSQSQKTLITDIDLRLITNKSVEKNQQPVQKQSLFEPIEQTKQSVQQQRQVQAFEPQEQIKQPVSQPKQVPAFEPKVEIKQPVSQPRQVPAFEPKVETQKSLQKSPRQQQFIEKKRDIFAQDGPQVTLPQVVTFSSILKTPVYQTKKPIEFVVTKDPKYNTFNAPSRVSVPKNNQILVQNIVAKYATPKPQQEPNKFASKYAQQVQQSNDIVPTTYSAYKQYQPGTTSSSSFKASKQYQPGTTSSSSFKASSYADKFAPKTYDYK